MLYSNYLRDKSQNAIKIKEAKGNPCIIENSKGQNLKDYKIYGNSYQATYGKNLWDEKQEFSFTGNGTQTGTNLNLSTSFKSNTQYTISLYFTASDITFSEEGNLVFLNISYTDGSSQYAGITSYNYTQGVALVTTLSGKSVYKIANITPHARFSSGTINIQKIQLEEGAEATSYEQYKNMPSVEFPSEVQSVGDLTTKNLFDISTQRFNGNNINVSIKVQSNKIIMTNKAQGAGQYCALSFNGFLKPNTTYTVTSIVTKIVNQDGGESAGSMEYIWYLQDNNTFSSSSNKLLVLGKQGKQDKNSVTFTTPEDMREYKYIVTRLSGYSTYIFEDIQFEEGSTATSYEPYHKYDIPISIYGKNLIKYPYRYTTRDINGIRFTDNGDGSVTMNGKATANAIWFMYLNRTNLIDGLSSGDKITLSVKSNKSFSGALRVVCNYFDTGGTEKDANISITAANSSRTNKITALWKGMEIYIVVLKGQTVDNITIYPQLEKGSPATSYEPYKGKTTTHIYLDEPLRKVGDYADYIDFKNQKVIRNIKEVTFDGTENWGYRDTYNIIYLSINNLASSVYCYSTHFLSEALKDTVSPYFRPVTGVLRLYQRSNNIVYSSADEFKTFLANQNTAGNPLVVDYILSTPIEENISLLPLQTFKDTNIISTDTFVQSSNINVKYIRI